tara:strand:- start:98 stop:562 length:465 start_codon:yes stop_codon:yes gene_type:complete
MQIRNWIIDKDYDTLVKWWNDWNFGVVPKECLPPDGIIVEVGGTPICAGGLYIGVGTQFAFMEWIVTDKTADKRQVHKALKLCVDGLVELAKTKGMKLIYTATKERELHKRYTKYHDFLLAETNVHTFLRDLDGKYSKDLLWISDDEQNENRNK